MSEIREHLDAGSPPPYARPHTLTPWRMITMGMLSDDERAGLVPAELAANPTPVPTQVVSSDEFLPIPQTDRQKKVEARMNALADD